MARNEFFPAQLIFILFTGYKFLNVCLSRLFGSFTNIYLRQMCLAHLRFSNPVNNARKLKQQSYSWPRQTSSHHIRWFWPPSNVYHLTPDQLDEDEQCILPELRANKKCCNPHLLLPPYHNCISYDWAFQVRTQWVKLPGGVLPSHFTQCQRQIFLDNFNYF